MIVTAGGKNVAPAVLEDRLRSHALISQAMVVGDGKPFIAALITLDPEALGPWKERHGKPADATVATLREDPDLIAAVQKRGRRREQGGVAGGVDQEVPDPRRATSPRRAGSSPSSSASAAACC